MSRSQSAVRKEAKHSKGDENLSVGIVMEMEQQVNLMIFQMMNLLTKVKDEIK